MNIYLTKEQENFLKQYASLYNEERKIDWTMTPIVVVENERFIVSNDEYINDKEVYIVDGDSESEYELDELIELGEYTPEQIEEAKEAYCGETLDSGITKLSLARIWEPAAYFLTRAEAKKYCQYQKHNLINPRVFSRYVGYSNSGDLAELMLLLRNIGETLLKGEE